MPKNIMGNVEKMAKLITTKHLTLAIMMGTIGLVMQATLPGIPLGLAGAKLELADIPVILGSSLTGPIGGIICGFLYGIASPAYLALVPSMVCILSLIGYLSKKRNDLLSVSLAIIVSRVILGPLLLAFSMKHLCFPSATYFDTWLLSFTYAVPGAIVSIVVYTIIQKAIPQFIKSVKVID